MSGDAAALTREFLSRWATGEAGDGGATAAALPEDALSRLALALHAAVAAGQAAWPALSLDPRRFIHQLADHTSASCADPAAALPSRHAADLYLACACAAGLPQALSALEQHYITRTGAYIGSLHPSPLLVDETQQALRARLLLPGPGGATTAPRKIAQYSGRGSLDSWMCAAALRCALTLLRRERAAGGPAPSMAAELIHPPDPELQFIKDKYRDDFVVCLREAMAALSPRERNILRLYHVQKLTMIQIARAYGTHRTTITRWLELAHKAVLDGTRERLRLRLRLAEGELDSLLRALHSGLEVSLQGLLASSGKSE